MNMPFTMKSIPKILTVSVAAALVLSNVGCMTTYDAGGNPVQTVDPAVAIAGATAAGVIGYAIAKDNRRDHRYHNHYYGHGYPRRGYYRY
jgi:hypothetical protein